VLKDVRGIVGDHRFGVGRERTSIWTRRPSAEIRKLCRGPRLPGPNRANDARRSGRGEAAGAGIRHRGANGGHPPATIRVRGPRPPRELDSPQEATSARRTTPGGAGQRKPQFLVRSGVVVPMKNSIIEKRGDDQHQQVPAFRDYGRGTTTDEHHRSPRRRVQREGIARGGEKRNRPNRAGQKQSRRRFRENREETGPPAMSSERCSPGRVFARNPTGPYVKARSRPKPSRSGRATFRGVTQTRRRPPSSGRCSAENRGEARLTRSIRTPGKNVIRRSAHKGVEACANEPHRGEGLNAARRVVRKTVSGVDRLGFERDRGGRLGGGRDRVGRGSGWTGWMATAQSGTGSEWAALLRGDRLGGQERSASIWLSKRRPPAPTRADLRPTRPKKSRDHLNVGRRHRTHAEVALERRAGQGGRRRRQHCS